MPSSHSLVPEIPGIKADPSTTYHLAQRVSELCGLRESRFPGTQPVSFTTASLDLLERMDFWVCEKSDGIRLLIFVVMNGASGEQEAWLDYRQVQGLHFPHWENKDAPLTDTIIDGELVNDIDPNTGETVVRFYAFDCLVVHGEKILSKPLQSRFGRLKSWIVEPFNRALVKYPEWRNDLPFELIAKKQELSYHIKQVLDVHVPALQHGHDGLIFTCAESEYVMGTDEKILKWKPPSENSIDFKLELRFPSLPDSDEVDLSAKPVFSLHTWTGGQGYEYFDELDIDDDEWERMKESNEQYDDRIIEVCWNTDIGGWKLMRIRDDKPHANHKTIMQKILISIEDGVEIEAVLARSDAIKAAWKARQQNPGSRAGASHIGPMRTGSAHGRDPVTPGGARGGGYAAGGGGGGGGSHAQGVIAGLRR